MKWLFTGAVALAGAFLAYSYFIGRLAREETPATSFTTVYSADILVAAATLAATLGILVALIHASGRARLPLLVACPFLLFACVLSMREIRYTAEGTIHDTWFLVPGDGVAAIGASGANCIRTDAFAVIFSNPESGMQAVFFRGVWPWSYADAVLQRLMPACES